MKIFTHFNVDLDAVGSVWAAREFILGAESASVEFRPANWDENGMSEDDLALDMEAGGRGMKGKKEADGIVHYCFASIVSQYASPADQAAPAKLVRFVDAQDSRDSAVKFLAPEASREAKDALTMTGLNAVACASSLASSQRHDGRGADVGDSLWYAPGRSRASTRGGRGIGEVRDPAGRQGGDRRQRSGVRHERRAVR